MCVWVADRDRNVHTYITTIKRPSHLAHGGRHDISLLKLSARRFFHEPRRFDPQDAWELDVGAVALSREHLAAVQTACFDADEDPAWLWGGDGALLGALWC